MVWSLETSNGREADKIASIAVPYLQGKCLDIGCGLSKVWPSLIGIDSLKDYGGQRPPGIDIVSEGDDLSMFASKSCDGVFSSHFLEHTVDFKACLKEWWRVIKPGGYLVLYLPHKSFYPNIGQPGGNPDHKFDFMPDDIINAMKKIGSWEMLENEERNGGNEYSFYQVYRKLEGKAKHIMKVWKRNPKGMKRALVIRYGAIGDQLMAASILPQLKKQGYYVTYNTAHSGYEVLKNDPHIDEWLVQGKDFVPNVQLGPYWQALAYEKRYDKIINLCESIEGGLLALPGRLQHDYNDDTRRKLFSTVNYLERTHDIAAVPYDFAAKFYPTKEEIKWAKAERAKIKGPVMYWAVNGSAFHKVYPWVQVVVAWLLSHTGAHVFLMGDAASGIPLQDGIIGALEKDNIDTSRVHKMCGKWDIRKALTFALHVDCVVGPETGAMNAAGMEAVKKVVYLSHSSPENLTKHWKNVTVLTPDMLRAPCYPCNRLHYNWDNCFKDDKLQSSVCASGIAPQVVFEAIMKSLNFKKVMKPVDGSNPSPPNGTNSARKAA